MKLPGYIAVEGPIGVGKTSLVERLAASLGGATLLEQAEDNPFLERFYRDPRAAALPAQLHFLFQRSRQLEALHQGDLFRQGLVADFMFEKDRLFAGLNLERHELGLYEQVYARLAMTAPTPDLVVYLQAPVEVLLARIRKRARPQEATIDPGYLQRLSVAYTEFFYHYHAAPVLIVNAADINPVDSAADFAQLREQILAVRPGKRYFNAAPLALA